MTKDLSFRERQLINYFRACDERGKRSIVDLCRLEQGWSVANKAENVDGTVVVIDFNKNLSDQSAPEVY